MVMDVDKKYMAIMAVVCFMVVSAGFVSILDDADAAGEVSVVSYDSRAGKGGQLVLNASTTPVRILRPSIQSLSPGITLPERN